MRLFVAIFAIAAPAAAFAGDGLLGTKASPVGPMQADTGGVGGMPLLQMLLALGIVLVLLKWLMPKLVTKVNKKIVTNLNSAIKIEESAAFAGGNLYIVQAKSKSLLLSVTASGVNCLADLTEPTPTNPHNTEPTFSELIEKEKQGPLQPFAIVETAEVNDPDEQTQIAVALERLTRLAK